MTTEVGTGTLGTKYIKTDWPEEDTENPVLKPEESDNTEHWGSI